jgi:hypothetical protein
MKYEFRSLTESFQVKQIITLLGILKPLALSFTIGYILALTCHLCGVYVLMKGHREVYVNLTGGKSISLLSYYKNGSSSVCCRRRL